MNSQYTYNIPQPMSHITTTPLRQRLLHTPKSSHLLTLILTVTLLAWGNCAWAQTVTATWDFTKSGYPASAIQSTSTLAANVGTAIEMTVIANPGKLSDNTSTAQFNKGTILRIPVVSANDVITVTSYVDDSRPINYVSVAGTAMSVNPTTYNVQSDDVTIGYVDVKAEENTYIKSVTIEQHKPLVTGPTTYTWDMKDWTSIDGQTYPQQSAGNFVNFGATEDSEQKMAYYGDNTKVASASYTFADGKTWTYAIQFSKSDLIQGSENGVFKYHAPNTGSVKVYFKGGGFSERTIYVNKELSQTNATTASGASNANGILEYTISEAGDVYIFGSATFYIYAIVATIDANNECSKPEATKGNYSLSNGTWAYTLSATPHKANIHYTINGEQETVVDNNSTIGIPANAAVEAWATMAGITDSEHLTFTTDPAPTASLCADKTSANLALYPLIMEKKLQVAVTGTMLTGSTKNAVRLASPVEGVSFDKSSLTINDGNVSETITLTYARSMNKTESEKTVNLIIETDNNVVSIPITFSAQTQTYTQTNVDGNRTWTWNDIYKEQIKIQDNTEKKVTSQTEINFANLWPWYNASSNFHASDLQVWSNYPIYGSATDAYFHGNKIKFHTNVPGNFKITKYASGKKDDNRTITVRVGTQSTTLPASAQQDDYKTPSEYIDVPANTDVVIEGSGEVRIWGLEFQKKNVNTINLRTNGSIIQGGGEYSLTLTKGDEYTLTNGADYILANTVQTVTFVSSKENVATVGSNGKITTLSSGTTVITIKQAANNNYSAAEVSFTLRVNVNKATSTTKPKVTVSSNGQVSVVNSADNPNAKIYYTVNGDDPTTNSTEYTESFTPADNSIIKVIAKADDKDMSETVIAYKNVQGSFTWQWHGDANVVPEISDNVRNVVDSGTKAMWGSELSFLNAYNSVKDNESWPRFQPLSKKSKAEDDGAFNFIIIPLTGYSFRPTAASFDFSREGTDGGNIDVAFVAGADKYTLLENSKPQRNSANPKYSHYSTVGAEATPTDCVLNMSDIPASDAEWSLRIYQYGLDASKSNLIGNVIISGVFSGVEYDGDFYGVSVKATPEDAGTVTQSPSATRIMAGKKVTFTAIPKVGYKFTGWTHEGETIVLSTNRTYCIESLNDITNMEAHFESLPLLTFTSNEHTSEVNGILPEAVYADEVSGKVYLPKNLTLYRENWTMIGWTDGINTYEPGSYILLKENKTVKPVFKQNTVNMRDTDAPLTVCWNLYTENNKTEVPEINLSYNGSNSTGYYTKRTSVNGEDIDISLYMEAIEGSSKILNNDEGVIALGGGEKPGIQINNAAKIAIPAMPGMKVTIKASSKVDDRSSDKKYTKFVKDQPVLISFGTDKPNAKNEHTVEYTYTGNETSLVVTFVNQGEGEYGFYEYIEVQYPVLPDVKLSNSITEKLDMETHENAGVLTKPETTHRNTGSRYAAGDVITITATAAYGYTITGFTKSGTGSGTGSLATPIISGDGKSATVQYTVGTATGIVTAKYKRMETIKIRVQSADEKLGTVSLEPAYENFIVKGKGFIEGYYVNGTDIKLVSQAADGNVLDYWMDDAGKWKNEAGTPTRKTPNVQVKVTKAENYTAYFKLGVKGSVKFSLEGSGILGGADNNGSVSLVPDPLTDVRSFTIPTNFTFFKNGYTLKGWGTNGDATYSLGQSYSFADTQTITLKPVFEENPATQENRQNNPVIRYDFGSGIFDYTDTDPAVPAEQRSRKVSAQKVNIGSNVNTFWTSKVYVNALDGGVSKPHWRDVAMWVNTGSKGFIRNGDLPEWAAFGPGTTFEVASGSGTKFSMMVYAPITTTTIDGVVPTLDEARSNPANHEYVYTHTTRSAEDRVKIVIGDDYSYYKWLEAATQAANMVDLHADSEDEVRGVVLSTVSGTEFKEQELEDGGYSFQKGNKVVLTFQRKFGFEFDKIVDLDNLDANGHPSAVLEMLNDGTVRMNKKNNPSEFVLVSDTDNDGVWGDLASYVFKLTKIETTGQRTKYQVEFEITTHRNLQIVFKEKPTYYVMYNAGKQATGTAPAASWVEAGDKYTIPYNHTLYLEGYTLKKWVADNNQYDIGKEYTFPANRKTDILMYPVFVKNTFSLIDVNSDATAKWPFAVDEDAPIINYERSAGILVAQLYKDSNKTDWIDLKADLDGKVYNGVSGKFNNTASTDRCQINSSSTMSFPTTQGCDILLTGVNDIKTTVIAGKTSENGGYTPGKTVKATYTGTEAIQMVNFKDDGRYYTKFEVTYKPQNITRPTLASVKYGETSLSSEQLTTLTNTKSINMTIAPDLENDALPVVTATANNGGEVTITQADINNRSALITLKTAGGVIVETYSVNFLFIASSSPTLSKMLVNGNECVVNATPENQTVLANQPVTGTIVLTFDRTMAAIEKELEFNGKKIKMSAKQGKVLEFHYWNISTGNTYQVYIPANTLVDVYGSPYTGEIRFQMTSSTTSIEPIHKTFDYIVGQDGNINEAIAAANSATGTDRYYIYIPDGEYELKGNQNITSAITSDGVAPADSTGVRRTDLIGQTFNNGMTQITRANVSLIGQSTKGVTLYNRPLLEGIGYTATIHVGKNATDFYAEDLQLVNRFPYWKSLNSQGSSGAGRAVAFWDQGNRSIMKNVELWSYQDTYYSSNANDDYRGYFENCTIAGVVDFLCGDGNIWLDNCNIVLRDRAGNNIAAPSQERTQQWGYVFSNCSIKPEVDNAKDLKDRNWSLARPWASSPDKSPAITYLNTKMWLLPRDAGWEKMGTGAILRFHEYHSMDKGGNQISLGARSLAACAPGAGSDDCILSADDAATYTLENVLGGTDLFTPKAFTQQIDADDAVSAEKDAHNSFAWVANLRTDDDRLVWDVSDMALCYFVFKKEGDKWVYKTNVAQAPDAATCSVSVEQFGTGDYCLRAANQRGGLGAATAPIHFTVSRKYTLEIKKLETVGGVDYGWSTLCLPYNSKVPVDLKVYAANGVAYPSEGNGTISTVDNYNLYLKEVTVVNKDKGYIVYGPVGTYLFASSSQISSVVTILDGNPNDEPIPTGNNNCYVLANKETYGLGFYKYTGATLAAHRAWLPVGSVSTSVASNSAKAIKMVFTDEFGNTTAIGEITADGRYEFHKAEIYDLNGIRIQTPVRGRVYIINGEKRQWK